MKYGNKYADVLSNGLSRKNEILNFFLSGNRLSESGADNLLRTISKKAKILDLSNNRIGSTGCDHIAYALLQKECKYFLFINNQLFLKQKFLLF